MKKVGFFTTNSIEFVHPRIAMQVSILKDAGFEVEIFRTRQRREGIFELLNWFSLKFFKRKAIRDFSKKIADFDIVHIYDFQLLPLAKKAKSQSKKVIYETLDDNVYLHFHSLSKKIPLLKRFEKLIISRMSRYERSTTDSFCDHVIVNSANLLENFNQAELIYYASNLEDLKVHPYDPTRETVFLYSGKLTTAKGSNDYRDLVKKYQKRLIFFGKAMDAKSEEIVAKNVLIEGRGNFDSSGLHTEISRLLKDKNVIGLSIIHPENKSYALQEANKDIDYMAMGMPFIGNDRKPTFSKIKAGAGVLVTDHEKIMDLCLNTNDLYNQISEKSQAYYQQFSKREFEEKLLAIYQQL